MTNHPEDNSPQPPSPGGGGSTPARAAGRGDTAANGPTGEDSHGGAALSRFRRRAAKRLRANTTDAERKLWRALKNVPIEGTHFRRQVSIGPYVADFACLAARLIIELDGGHHSRDDVARKDRVRQDWLEAEGYRVLRFWNAEVASNLDGVLDTIYAALHGSLADAAEPFRHARRPRCKGVTPPRRLLRSRRPSPSRGG